MRPFFESQASAPSHGVLNHTAAVSSLATATAELARIAVYDSTAAAPRVLDIAWAQPAELIERLSSTVYDVARGLGGSIPYTVVREITENLVHAGFREVVVSVLNDGDMLRFADQGPGITDKQRALVPGFTTATTAMKRFIRGVGSGLPIVDEYVRYAGGRIEIEDNLGRGTVVTVSLPGARHDQGAVNARPASSVDETPGVPTPPARLAPVPAPRLTNRHKQVLFLVLELGTVGPAAVTHELGVALSTAHRDLQYLETIGFLNALPGGKRRLTDAGSNYLETMFGT